VFGLALGATGLAHAHPAPAAPPLFEPAACVRVVDASVEPSLHIPYALEYDDTMFTEGDIRLPDAKTHQFFALRGALVWSVAAVELVDFDPTAVPQERIALPLWIDRDDVTRAAAAVDGSGTMFMASDVPPDALLDAHPALQGRVVRIDQDDARRPITLASADSGASWGLEGVEPGLYSIATYIFSPPYNGWAVRPGLVNIVRDASVLEQRAPAATLSTVAMVLRSFQGRRVRGCVDGPAGTTVRAEALAVDRPELGWQPWLQQTPLASALRPGANELALCFQNPFEQGGAMRVRIVLRGPDGGEIAAYSPDTLTVLQGEGECVETDQICCPPATPPADAGMQPTADSGPGGPAPTTTGPAGCSTTTLRSSESSTTLCLLLSTSWLAAWTTRRRAVALCSTANAELHVHPRKNDHPSRPASDAATRGRSRV